MKYYFNNYLYSFASELSDNIDFIISNNPTLASEIQNLPIKYKKWLADRFGKSPIITEIHPVQDCLPTLKIFSEKENGISAKYKSNQQFKNDIDNEFPLSDRGWLTPADATLLSINNMERILSLLEKKKAKVKLDTTTSYESDRIGKVGPWNIWLPSTQQNSINIAGYDPETNKEYTDWCTARITGSNLFYNYVLPNFMLFYVIKDNPSGDNDWLSIGVLEGQIVYNGDGRESVNRDNEGLTEESLKGILGKFTFEKISNIILDKYKSLSGQSPASVKVKEASESLDKLKEVVRTNSESEKDYFYRNLLSNYELSEEILEYISNSKNSYLREAVVQKTNNEKILEKLAMDQAPDVRIAVAQKTNNEKILEILALDEKPNVRTEVALKTNNEALLEKLALDEDPYVRVIVAQKTNNEALLAQIAGNKDIDMFVKIRIIEVTNNENLLAQIARDKEPTVRMAVAQKTNDEKLLEILASDENTRVRLLVVRKTNNENLLAKLARDEDPSVRMEVVQTTNNKKLLAQLARDKDPNVRLEVAEKTNNKKLLAQLAMNEDRYFRGAVAYKTNNEKILEQLAMDEDPYVRDTARRRLQNLKMKAKASSNKINQILKKATLYYKLTNNYFN